MRVRFGRLHESLRSSEQKVPCKDRGAEPKTSVHATRALTHGWHELPQDLVKRIIQCSTAEQGWSARKVSRSWAEAARQTCCFQALVPCKCSSVVSEMETIFQQQLVQRLPHVSFTLMFTEPASFAELAELLILLANQAIHPVPVKLAARLLIAQSDLDLQLLSHTASITSTSALLLSYGVTVTISFCAADKHVRIPTPAMLSQLAPLLQSVDLHSVPMQQSPPSEASLQECLPFTAAHIAELRRSPFLTSLCILDNRTASLSASISAIAQLWSLTKLHLTAPRYYLASDFQPLSQLTAIQDLALQSSDFLSCPEVLSASRQTLRFITLASPALCAATYQALGQLPALNRLTIKIWGVHDAEGDGFRFLTAKFVHLEILHVDHHDDLLSWANICHIMQVHELTLWRTSDRAISLLRSMPFLQTLSIVNSPDFTGSTLSCHPNVTSLSLINCGQIGRGLKHMLAAALPQVTRLEIQASHDPFTAVQMSHQVLEALAHGHCLEMIDLRGLTGTTASDVRQLQSLFSCSSSPVTVKLPYVEIGHHQPVINAIDGELYLPNLIQLLGHARYNSLELGKVVKPRALQPVLRTIGTVLVCVAGVCAALR